MADNCRMVFKRAMVIGKIIEEQAFYKEEIRMENIKDMDAREYALYRVEMTRRELMRINASVEMGHEIGERLSEILVTAINAIEELVEEEE